MASNPLIDQGVLNRIKASISWTNFSNLNVTAPFLDRDMISFRRTGPATTSHPTATGLVKSPEAYVPIQITIALLRTQPLAAAYQLQEQSSTLLGPGTVYPDVTTGISPWNILNMSIDNLGDMLLNGTTPIYGVECSGYYVLNNNLFN
jgi:hypothetical protein